MAYETLVDVDTLASHLGDPRWRIVDCRFKLGDPEAGARAHAEGTIPGAIFADLERDLSGPVTPGRTGRHPLPTREAFAATLGRWGITASTQVVAFDDMGGAFAARLWWMLRWVGHRSAAVLDGGIAAWKELRARRSIPPPPAPIDPSDSVFISLRSRRLEPGRPFAGRPTVFEPGPSLVASVTADEVLAALDDRGVAVLDARAAGRYRGEGESIDPIAGHIAGARSAPFLDNLDEGSRFRSPADLRARFEQRLAGTTSDRAIAYCGSGVTACHDVLAMAHAGLPTPRLYPGSWSEWITDPSRPRATGDEPG
jgi:thiosulfate/3-mercaptopyruvate sulfurtransferase